MTEAPVPCTGECGRGMLEAASGVLKRRPQGPLTPHGPAPVQLDAYRSQR